MFYFCHSKIRQVVKMIGFTPKMLELIRLVSVMCVCLFKCCLTTQSTAMVNYRRLVDLPTLFLGIL